MIRSLCSARWRQSRVCSLPACSTPFMHSSWLSKTETLAPGGDRKTFYLQQTRRERSAERVATHLASAPLCACPQPGGSVCQFIRKRQQSTGAPRRSRPPKPAPPLSIAAAADVVRLRDPRRAGPVSAPPATAAPALPAPPPLPWRPAAPSQVLCPRTVCPFPQVLPHLDGLFGVHVQG